MTQVQIARWRVVPQLLRCVFRTQRAERILKATFLRTSRKAALVLAKVISRKLKDYGQRRNLGQTQDTRCLRGYVYPTSAMHGGRPVLRLSSDGE